MRNLNPLLRSVLILGALAFHSVVRAGDEGIVEVEVLANAPAENVLISFTGSQEPDGWGWHRDASDTKDTGISFRSPVEGSLQKVTFRIENIPVDFLEDGKFNLQVWETNALTENPLDGRMLYSGSGTVNLQRKDAGMYLGFALGKPIQIRPESFYTVLLSWESPAGLVVLQANFPYTEGLIWSRDGASGGEFKPMVSSGQPGLVFFIQ